MSEGLKPCPFCGGEAHSDVSVPRRHNSSVLVYARCDACKACGPYVPANKTNGWSEGAQDKAAEAWNRRADKCDRGECEMKYVYYELFPCDSVYRCMKCGTENPWEFKFCPGCGAKVTSTKEYCIKSDPEPDPDLAELLEVADEIEQADVDCCVGWHDRIRKALGVER